MPAVYEAGPARFEVLMNDKCPHCRGWPGCPRTTQALGHVWTAPWQELSDVLQHWSGAVTCPASHDAFSVNGFLPTTIRGELSCCRASLLTSHPAGWFSRPLSHIRDGRASKERHHSVETAPKRHAGQRRRSLGSPGLQCRCSAARF